MITFAHLRAVLGLDRPLLDRAPYGRWHVSAESAARAAETARRAARRAKVRQTARQLRELGYGGLAELLEMSERRKDSRRNGHSRRGRHG